MTEITQELLKSLLSYDPDTGVFIWRVYRSFGVRAGCVAGTTTKKGYISIKLTPRRYLAHRLAWLYMHGTWPPNQIDHINRVRSDNRITNLRLATAGQNAQNRSRDNVSGVNWHKSARKWRAYISVDRRWIYLGLFKDYDSAVAARQTAELIHHSHRPD